MVKNSFPINKIGNISLSRGAYLTILKRQNTRRFSRSYTTTPAVNHLDEKKNPTCEKKELAPFKEQTANFFNTRPTIKKVISKKPTYELNKMLNKENQLP